MSITDMTGRRLIKPETMKTSARKINKSKGNTCNNLATFEEEYCNREVWKPTVIPENFKLIIDTREQLPLYTIADNIPIINKAIKNGDYSVVGYEDMICIERKMVSDFFTYLGKDRDKTCEKLERMRDYYFKALVVEANERDLYDPQIYTRMTKEHVRGFFKSVRVKYGMHVYCNSDREYVKRYVLDSLVYAYKQLEEQKITGGK